MRADLLIFDGRHLLYRSSSSFAQLSAEVDGEDVATGGMYGFLSAMLRVHSRYRGRAVVCWEGKTNFRKELHADYKKRSKKTPEQMELLEEIKRQEDMLIEVLTACGVTQYRGVNCEADDAIGLLSRAASGLGKASVIYSGDSDLTQLVNDHTALVSPDKGKDRVYDAEAVEERYGVPPERIPELKALMGDTSDNIPGVKGIGQVTAAKLIQQYDTVNEVIRAAAGPDGWPVAERFRKAILECEDLPLYRKLVQIDTNCRVELTAPKRSQKALLAYLHAYRFRSLAAPAELSGLLKMGGAK